MNGRSDHEMTYGYWLGYTLENFGACLSKQGYIVSRGWMKNKGPSSDPACVAAVVAAAKAGDQVAIDMLIESFRRKVRG